MKVVELSFILLFTTHWLDLLRGRNKGPAGPASRTFFSSHPIPCPLGGEVSASRLISGQRRRPGCRARKSLFTAPIDKGRGGTNEKNKIGGKEACAGEKMFVYISPPLFHPRKNGLGPASVRPPSSKRDAIDRERTRSTYTYVLQGDPK